VPFVRARVRSVLPKDSPGSRSPRHGTRSRTPSTPTPQRVTPDRQGAEPKSLPWPTVRSGSARVRCRDAAMPDQPGCREGRDRFRRRARRLARDPAAPARPPDMGDVGLDRVSDRSNAWAISVLVRPRAISAKTSSSRGVKGSARASGSGDELPGSKKRSSRRRVAAGATTASPAATAADRGQQLKCRDFLEAEARSPGSGRVDDPPGRRS
jgi:hypothetical protein